MRACVRACVCVCVLSLFCNAESRTKIWPVKFKSPWWHRLLSVLRPYNDFYSLFLLLPLCVGFCVESFVLWCDHFA